MTSLLDRLARLVGNDDVTAASATLMLVLTIANVGCWAFAGGSLTGWIQLAVFICAAQALVSYSTLMGKGVYNILRAVITIAVGSFLLDLFSSYEGNRFPGMRLTELWLVLLLGVVIVAVDVAIDEWDDPEEHEPIAARSPLFRFARVFLKAICVAGIGFLAVYHSWAMLLTFIIVEAALGLAYLLVRNAAPEDVPTRSAVTA